MAQSPTDRSGTNSPASRKSVSPIPSRDSSGNLTPSQVYSAATGAATAPKHDSKPKRGNLPAAATGGAASKVTWRNREQEASDPDFQRRHHPTMLQMPVTIPHVNAQYHGHGHQYAQSNGMMGNVNVNGHMNGHMVHPAGYHFGTIAADGQMYNSHGGHGVNLQMYTQVPQQHYQDESSWQQQMHDYGASAHQPQPLGASATTANAEYHVPTLNGAQRRNAENSTKSIDLSQEEFPALR